MIEVHTWVLAVSAAAVFLMGVLVSHLRLRSWMRTEEWLGDALILFIVQHMYDGDEERAGEAIHAYLDHLADKD